MKKSPRKLSDYERNVLLTISRATLPSIGALPPGGSETAEKVERFLTEAGTATFWVYRILLWVIELSAIITTGRRFSQLPADRGEKWLVRWGAGPAVTRAVLMAVSTPIKVAHFDDPRIYEHFGRVHDRRAQQVERPRYMDQVTAGRDLPADKTIECDVVVVGTGAGGAVVAKELAEAGLAVVMLEEGDFFTRKDFSGRLWDAQRMLYRDKGFTVTLGNTIIPVPMGVTVGGSTTINTGTCWRTPEWILNRWVNDHGLDELTPDRMAPHFDRVEKILRIQAATPEQVGAVGRVIARGCDALGWTHLPVKRNAPECDGSGVCNFGCPIDAKLGMDLSYVPLALKSASVLFTRVRADRVWIENGRAAGVLARTRDGGKNVRFRSRAVVVACGAIMTPYFLLRQGICNRSGLVGRNLSIHPAVGAAALFNEEIRGYAATPQGYCVNQFHKDGILLLGASVPIDVAAAQFIMIGRELMEAMEAYDRVATFGGMVEDEGVGRVRPGPGGRPLMTYSVNAETLDKLKRAAAAIARIFLRAGAKWVHPHVQRAPTLRSDSDVDAFLRSPWKARDFILTAYHPLGTCRMGIDPLTSVINQNHESHDLPGLFIADGSVMPSSVAVNPQETIMAMATRAAERIAAKLT